MRCIPGAIPRFFIGFAMAAAPLSLPLPASAQESFPIEVCNQSPYVAAVALSYQRDQEYGTDYWFYDGWRIVYQGECQELGRTPNRYVYLFATELNNPDRRWAGGINQCVMYPGPYGFVVHRDEDCPYGSQVEPFEQYFIDEGYSGFVLNLE